MRAKGFDTSRHNHPGDLPIDFQIAYDAGYTFWCGRLSVGNYYIDPWIVRDYQAASLTPFVKTVYHVPRAGYDTPSQVAKLREGLALLPNQPAAIVLDMEGEDGQYTGAEITACLEDHISLIRDFWTGKIILYLNLNYLNNVLWSTFGLDIWISWPAAGGAYNPNPDPPVLDWREYQRSFTHTIPGHPDLTVDLDEFNGDETEMLAYFAQEEIPDMATILENIAQVKTWLAQADALMDVIAQQAQEQPTPEPPPPPPPPPDPSVTIRITRDPRANAFYTRRSNAAGRPIMEIYPSDSAPTSERIQFPLGTQLRADPTKITADGGGKFWKLLDERGRGGETLYIREQDAGLHNVRSFQQPQATAHHSRGH